MKYSIVSSDNESTVVAEYTPDPRRDDFYQSEAQLEQDFIKRLVGQGYEFISVTDEAGMISNLRCQLEALNGYTFTDSEWTRFFSDCLANKNEGIVEKTRKIQDDYVQILKRDDGTTKNIHLIDKRNIHNNRLQVLNQYAVEANGIRPNTDTQADGWSADGWSADGWKAGGWSADGWKTGGWKPPLHANRYDVTVLVNGLPLVHIELKRRGVAISEAFNEINRYQRESFWAASGLFEYVQLFVISNGTHTKYYSNTTRFQHIKESTVGAISNRPMSNPPISNPPTKKKTSNSFEFTSYWADGTNKVIADLEDFTKTFFAKHTILNILTRYCVFTAEELLLVMRPYQIAATERILNRIGVANNYKKYGGVEGGGYIWHTTGSGKTLTSFKTAQLAKALPYIDKVLFVVDRKDLDYQTMREYDRFEKGAASSSTSTAVLKKQLDDPNVKIIITTIQKLDRFISKNKSNDVFGKRIVLIFDECHRSQFGDMHQAITRAFKKYHIFGFTGTPIFPSNAGHSGSPLLRTTEQAFGDKLHTYTIVDAINDGNVLPFRIDYVNTIKMPDNIQDTRVRAIDTERAMAAPERITGVVAYILDHFDQKTKRQSFYSHKRVVNVEEVARDKAHTLENRVKEDKKSFRVGGYNSIFAVSNSIMIEGTRVLPVKLYYDEFKRQLSERNSDLRIATIFSFAANEEELDTTVPDEDFDNDRLDQSSHDFLKRAIVDYNAMFGTAYDTSADKFPSYYKDISLRMKNREIDILIVVNMFLTGFDATTMNTLWVDKGLKHHGLIQAFSRTNRILNSVKTFGNIICFRDLKKATDDAIALFGDREAGGIVLLKTYDDYYNGYEQDGKQRVGYKDLIERLLAEYPLGIAILGETAKKAFIALFGAILRLRNILTSFDDFAGNEILSARDFQDYQSLYIDLYQEFRPKDGGDKENINDDIIFEIELIKQIEVNIDYILMLVAKFHESNCTDKEILTAIDKAVNSSIELRSKKELIKVFISRVNTSTQVDDDWQKFVHEQKETDLADLIANEKLKEDEARRFIDNSFRDGVLKTTGTDIDRILPPVSRFGGGNRQDKKQSVIAKLCGFFEKYLGLV
ncbi:MAG: type I restriction endonuclease subunit R [Defluviitaleaceae bacterium]|nr:type I restriction endonuclease subunit R [Defluviitaleaceae bacterium]